MKMENEIRVSVRSLVEFVLRHGDIDNRHRMSADNAMQEGGRIHRMIQRRMGAEYQAEVPLKISIPAEDCILIVEGRADGIIRHGDSAIVDEIKGTYRDIAGMRGPLLLHTAQAKCYAYMYGSGEELKKMRVRMTYCHIPTEELRYFDEDYTLEELKEWFMGLTDAYRRWADYAWKWREIRQKSIEGLKFPYPYREGQRELAVNVYSTIFHKKKLFLEAPTGVGKTISTLYPSVQAMGKGMCEKIFYLTAKTITRTVAEDALNLLRGKGLRLKSVILTAKEKICFMEEAECNPEYCPYAKGHYDRINDALYELLTAGESFGREVLESFARRHMVCPFEMCLDMSLFADAVICDYNYLFDPHVCLKRFFGDNVKGDYVFLIDEAHNLPDRGREMYSAVLIKEKFLEVSRELKQTIVSENERKGRKADILGQMTLETTIFTTDMSERKSGGDEEEKVIDQIGTGPAETVKSAAYAPAKGVSTEYAPGGTGPDGNAFGEGTRSERGKRRPGGGRSILIRQGYAEKLIYHLGKCNRELLAIKRECDGCSLLEDIGGFVQSLMRLESVMEDYLAEQEEEHLPVRDTLLEFYFEICHFLAMNELADENYVRYARMEDDGSFLLKLFCVNPRENLKNCMQKGRSTILFSATLLPIQYYKRLLGGGEEDYEVYARSVFDPAKRALLIAGDVTSKYSRRSEEEYRNIARYIEEIVKNRHGNYMVFCPSHSFLRIIYEKYTEDYGKEERECILQGETMSEGEREEFLARFRAPGEDRILIGFCVSGGIFGEGIDLKNDSLIGVIVVGTGLPQINSEGEILKDYFDAGGENGFDYAYRYPGMNKVLQAAGRVIRTVEDVGIVALLDERFLHPAYRRLFPREWEYFETVSVNTVAKRVEHFWNEWL